MFFNQFGSNRGPWKKSSQKWMPEWGGGGEDEKGRKRGVLPPSISPAGINKRAKPVGRKGKGESLVITERSESVMQRDWGKKPKKENDTGPNIAGQVKKPLGKKGESRKRE